MPFLVIYCIYSTKWTSARENHFLLRSVIQFFLYTCNYIKFYFFLITNWLVFTASRKKTVCKPREVLTKLRLPSHSVFFCSLSRTTRFNWAFQWLSTILMVWTHAHQSMTISVEPDVVLYISRFNPMPATRGAVISPHTERLTKYFQQN